MINSSHIRPFMRQATKFQLQTGQVFPWHGQVPKVEGLGFRSPHSRCTLLIRCSPAVKPAGTPFYEMYGSQLGPRAAARPTMADLGQPHRDRQ